jgi:hypothetical protein
MGSKKARNAASIGASVGASLGSRGGPVAAGIGAGFGGAVGYIAGAVTPSCGRKLLPDGGREQGHDRAVSGHGGGRERDGRRDHGRSEGVAIAVTEDGE